MHPLAPPPEKSANFPLERTSEPVAPAPAPGQSSCRNATSAEALHPMCARLGVGGFGTDGPAVACSQARRVGGVEGKVVVVGGGFAGVAAARRLRGWGYEVLVLEAQNRTGGRVWSRAWPSRGQGEARDCCDVDGGSAAGKLVGVVGGEGDGGGQEVGDGAGVVDLGGMVVTGTQGNPLVSLARSYGVALRA